ncbi:hypothetical protein QUF88_16795 [Bacillus sp. DX1.1]|uniref:hypothetical protein n=1 Tax=unclassified Bacillus (in: firmicutes) TaxID=185979 RepID=UPI0025700C01|nr:MULTISPECIES: hypothetical protein [unclassified Bacillus (in: firmicutes)]MDM5155402.1 hypothetical protein [Bacillus sp. DX1.1]WJE79717.1 hypothetical protein QRE67_14315 [Bacillus sp. DX3.1]
MQQRKAELVIGLVGSIIGTVMGFAIFIIFGFVMAIHNAITFALIIPFIIFILQIAAIFLSCRVNKQKRLYIIGTKNNFNEYAILGICYIYFSERPFTILSPRGQS